MEGAAHPDRDRPAIWIEIDVAAYRHNLRALRRILRPGARRMAVVKANSYGHGARIIASSSVAEGIDYLGVHSIDEQREIADLTGGAPVCLLGPTLPGEAEAVVAAGVEPTVSELEVARALAAAARTRQQRVAIHIKVETGTHRLGILREEIPAWCDLLRASPELIFRGLHTHYANIEDTTDQIGRASCRDRVYRLV
jgi:alanine racemase